MNLEQEVPKIQLVLLMRQEQKVPKKLAQVELKELAQTAERRKRFGML